MKKGDQTGKCGKLSGEKAHKRTNERMRVSVAPFYLEIEHVSKGSDQSIGAKASKH